MVKRRLVSPLPNLSSILPIFKRKFFLKIGLGIFFLYFFLNYQPNLSLTPVKKISTIKAQEPNQIQAIKAENIPLVFQIPHPGYISTYFSTYHPGVDIASGFGTPIKPIAPGTVSDAGLNFWGLGLIVEIDHGNGYKSLYAHLGSIYVQKGQQVTEVDSLGTVGLTGNTSGPHTHLEVSKDNNKLNPLAVLPEMRSYPEESDFQAVGGGFFEESENATPAETPKPDLEVKEPETPKETELEKLVKDPTLDVKTESILDRLVESSQSKDKPTTIVEIINTDLEELLSDQKTPIKEELSLNKLNPQPSLKPVITIQPSPKLVVPITQPTIKPSGTPQPTLAIKLESLIVEKTPEVKKNTLLARLSLF